jgi:hypothetical protein
MNDNDVKVTTVKPVPCSSKRKVQTTERYILQNTQNLNIFKQPNAHAKKRLTNTAKVTSFQHIQQQNEILTI